MGKVLNILVAIRARDEQSNCVMHNLVCALHILYRQLLMELETDPIYSSNNGFEFSVLGWHWPGLLVAGCWLLEAWGCGLEDVRHWLSDALDSRLGRADAQQMGAGRLGLVRVRWEDETSWMFLLLWPGSLVMLTSWCPFWAWGKQIKSFQTTSQTR